MLSENRTEEHQRNASGMIDAALMQKPRKRHTVSMLLLTMALTLGATGLLLYASMENNKASLSKIEELKNQNTSLTQETTTPLPQVQDNAQLQIPDTIGQGNQFNATEGTVPYTYPQIMPENPIIEGDLDALPQPKESPAEETRTYFQKFPADDEYFD